MMKNKAPAKGNTNPNAKAKTEKPKTPKAPPIKFGAAALAKHMGVTPQKARQLLRKQNGTLEKGARYNFTDEAGMTAKATELKELMAKPRPKKEPEDAKAPPAAE